jgi:hypothetical protein
MIMNGRGAVRRVSILYDTTVSKNVSKGVGKVLGWVVEGPVLEL